MEILNSGRGFYFRAIERLPTQLLFKMKLTAFIIIITCMHVSARGYSQTISFAGTNVRLASVFTSIEKQTGLSFFYNTALIKNTKPVTLDIKNAPLENALHEILKEEGLDFYMMGKTIFIVKKQTRAATVESISGFSNAKTIDVKGRVINQQGESLVGATVMIKNGKKATLTNERGDFELKGVSVGEVLEVTYLGYQKKEVEIKEGGIVQVEMLVANNKLDEAQVIAYGQTTQRFNVGNVTTIRGEDIAKQPVSNPLLALEGQVPGLFITQSSGLPGSGIAVQIQGQNSIANGNDPFYVIDGVPYTSQLIRNFGLILGGSGTTSGVSQNGNPLSFISPADIESISILKDADATAIYGSRAANGAILITTRKGKIGQSKANINAQQGIEQVPHMLPLMNTYEYLQMRHEALKNDGITSPASTDYDINGLWDTTRNTNWQKTLIGGTGRYTNVNGDISGGGDVQYLIGATFHRETTVFPGSFSDQKGSIHFNINAGSSNKKFRVQLSGNYLIDNNNLPASDLTPIAIMLAPDAPALYNPDGKLNWAPDNSSGSSTFTNPLAGNYNTYNVKTNNLVSNALLSYQIIPGLDIRSSFGYTDMQSSEINMSPLAMYAPELRSSKNRVSIFGNNILSSWIIEPQLTYKRIVGKGKLDFLAGATIQNNSNSSQEIFASGYNSDQVLGTIGLASSINLYQPAISTSYKYNAFFGRINYVWEDRYLLDFNIRRDGSSRFGSQNEFHNFGAIGAGWIFSQEDFIRRSLPFISFGKLRGSYGTTGNDQIGEYQFLNLYSPIVTAIAYQNIPTISPTGLPNPYLQWEETKKIQFGLELGILKDRAFLMVNFYRNRSSNQLVQYPLPIISGFSSVTENIAATVQNYGWEVILKGDLIKSRNFSWNSSINLTLPKNELVSFPNLSTSAYSQTYIIGQPLTVARLFHFKGVDPSTGLYQFSDSHGNLTTNPNYPTDATAIINSSPAFFGGFQNTFTFKKFSLDIFAQFTKQKGPNYFFGSASNAVFNSNQPNYLLSRWQKQGDITNQGKVSSNYGVINSYINVSASDAGYCDASYVRIKNVSFSYLFPDRIIRYAHFSYLKIYAQGQNLFTISSFKGLDVESRTLASLPSLRIVTLGIQIGL